MKISILFGLSVLVQQGTCLVPRACAAYVTARSGDTCASIAASVGITVTEFLRNNPSVSKCDSLAAGTRYCIDSSSTSPLQISTDGQCGGNLTCVGSSYGDCCSEHGWCGSTDSHCGAGCSPSFGVCSGPSQSQPSASQPGATLPPQTCPPPRTITATARLTITTTVSVAVNPTPVTVTVISIRTVATTVSLPAATVTRTTVFSTTATRTVTVTVTEDRWWDDGSWGGGDDDWTRWRTWSRTGRWRTRTRGWNEVD